MFLKLYDLKNLCEEKGIVETVRDAKSVAKANKIIQEYLNDNIKVSTNIIRDYQNQLRDEVSGKHHIHLEDLKKICEERAIVDSVKNAESIDKVKEILRNYLDNDTVVTKTIIKEYQNSLKKLDKNNNAIDVISANTVVQRDALVIDNAKAKLHEEISIEINTYKDTIKNLQLELESLRNLFSKYVNSLDDNEPKNKNKLSSTIHSLNELINSNDEKFDVKINKELLSKATKYVDSNALIKLESIVREGYDINSTIVQTILLAFIHQNSLL